jgi:hypothetical protein
VHLVRHARRIQPEEVSLAPLHCLSGYIIQEYSQRIGAHRERIFLASVNDDQAEYAVTLGKAHQTGHRFFAQCTNPHRPSLPMPLSTVFSSGQ